MSENPRPPFDPLAADAAIASIQSLDYETVSTDQIIELLKPILQGYVVSMGSTEIGMRLHQFVRGEKPKTVCEVKYPPNMMAEAGLAHQRGEQIFYCYSSRRGAFLEAKPKVGDTLTLIEWESTTALNFLHAGYIQDVFDALESKRPLPQLGETPFVGPEAYEKTVKFLADAFINPHTHNKLTAAITHTFLNGKPPLDGFMYPSVATQAETDNVVLRPGSADKHLRFLGTEFIRIDSIENDEHQFTILNAAPEVSSKGIIEWYGRSEGEPAKRYGTVGWEEFLQQKKDILSDYDSAKETNKNRPIKTEHGNVGEAKFREWMGESLPKKYGITSGFIIPDTRRMNYVTRHYDFIVYDVLDSPVLWASNSADKSQQGRERAIPAKYVRAVFEVKANFSKSTINAALTKLEELREYKDFLPEHFACGLVFFEVRQEEQSSSKNAEALFRDDIPGYFGGIILRAENINEKISGYFTFQDNEGETDLSIPLVKEVNQVGRTEEGNIVLQPGESAIFSNQDKVWNFDRAYTPGIKNVRLVWAHNSFPQFFLDFLDRLEGTHDPLDNTNRSNYGLSFLR